MSNLLKNVILRPVTICTIILLLMIFGVISTTKMPVNLLPNINMPMISVSCVYPGASADIIEEDVTKVIENSIHSLSEVNSISSYSLENVSAVVITFEYETNIEKKQQELEKIFKNIELPSKCNSPIVSNIDLNSQAVASVAVVNNHLSLEELSKVAEQIKTKYYNIEGVGSVEIVGSASKEVVIKSINGLEISTLLIVEALSKEDLNIPLGTIMNNGEYVSIKNASDITSIEELKSLPIKLDLPADFIDNFQAINNIINFYETATYTDYLKIISVLKEMRTFINTLSSQDVTTLNDSFNRIKLLKSLMLLLNNNSAYGLKVIYDNVIEPVTTDPSFINLSERDLQDLAVTYGIDYDILKWVQQNSASDGGMVKSLWDKLISFREVYPLAGNQIITYEQFAYFFQKGKKETIVYQVKDEDGNTTHSEKNIFVPGLDIVKDKNINETEKLLQLVDILNVNYFNNYLAKVSNNESMGYLDYVNLFNPCIINQYQINFSEVIISELCSNFFDDNINILTTLKKQLVNNEGLPIFCDGTLFEENINKDILTTDKLTSLLNNLNLVDAFYVLTPDVLNLIKSIDYNNIEKNNNICSIILPLAKIADIDNEIVFDSYAKYNDSDAVIINVYAKSDGNTSKIVKNVKKELNISDCELVLLDDRANFINDSISNILVSMIIGGVLAIGIIYLFVRKIRSAIIVGITMPLSVLISLLCLSLMGISLNMVSIGGLAVGVGMLVDNSIVVLESITKQRDMHTELFDSCVNGTKEVAGSLLASTITNVCVFFPILFIKGLTKEIFNDLVFSILYSMSFSFLTAIFVIPTLYYLLYKKDKKVNELEKNSSHKMSAIENKYRSLLRKCIKRKKFVSIIALTIFLSSLLLVLTFNVNFLPSIDKGLIEVTLNYQYGTSNEEANDITNELATSIKDVTNVDYVSYTIGLQGLLATEKTGVIRVQLDNKTENTKEAIGKIRDLVKNDNRIQSGHVTEIDGVVAEVTSSFSSSSINIEGYDIDMVGEVAEKVKNKLLENKDIVQATTSASEKENQFSIKIDKLACANKNIDYTTLVSLLRVGIASYDDLSLNIENENTSVIIKFNEKTTENVNNLYQIMVGFNDNSPVYLKDVATISETSVNKIIKKTDNKYVATISVETNNLSTSETTKILKAAADDVLPDYQGYTASSGGVSSYLDEAIKGLVIAFVVAFILLYAVMACQFESLIKPFIIIMAIPFGLTGALIFLFITNSGLNVVSLIGIIMLLGVMVNDAIVMIDKINLNIRDGMLPLNAVIEGSVNRLRAVWMTSLTTILALIPLSLGIGRGGELMQPMGIVVLGGLLLGTCVTLIIIPCFYSIIKKININD